MRQYIHHDLRVKFNNLLYRDRQGKVGQGIYYKTKMFSGPISLQVTKTIRSTQVSRMVHQTLISQYIVPDSSIIEE